MTRANRDWIDPNYLLEGKPSGLLTSNIPRILATGNLSALTTQVITCVALPLQAGDVVTSLTFVSATTAAGTPTNWWFALYSPAGALLAQTADQTNGAWAANTAKKVALSTPQTITEAGVYYAGIMVKASTVPTLAGIALHNAVEAGDIASLGYKPLAFTADGSLVATAPATLGTATNVATVPMVIAS